MTIYHLENFIGGQSSRGSLISNLGRKGTHTKVYKLLVKPVTPSESAICKFQRFPPNPHRNDSKVPTRHFRAGGKRSNNITQQSSMGPTEQIYIYNTTP